MNEEAASTSGTPARLILEERRCAEEEEGWRRKLGEYEHLKTRLCTLGESLSTKVMVPVGRKGMAEGRLVHTNKVTVLLGDDWFADLSAHQAAALVQRRETHIHDQLANLAERQAEIKRKSLVFGNLQSAMADIGQTAEIREEIPPEQVPSLNEKKGKRRMAHVAKYKAQSQPPPASSVSENSPSQELSSRTTEPPSEELSDPSETAPVGVAQCDYSALLKKLNEMEGEDDSDDESSEEEEEDDEEEDDGEEMENEDENDQSGGGDGRSDRRRRTKVKRVHWAEKEEKSVAVEARGSEVETRGGEEEGRGEEEVTGILKNAEEQSPIDQEALEAIQRSEAPPPPKEIVNMHHFVCLPVIQEREPVPSGPQPEPVSQPPLSHPSSDRPMSKFKRDRLARSINATWM